MAPALFSHGRRAFLAMAASVPLQSMAPSTPPAGVAAALRRACETLDELALEDIAAWYDYGDGLPPGKPRGLHAGHHGRVRTSGD